MFVVPLAVCRLALGRTALGAEVLEALDLVDPEAGQDLVVFEGCERGVGKWFVKAGVRGCAKYADAW
ncbi:hypothetical protein PtrM4_089640 [Pyrenophora tritici-repentis]|uniref:Uncharacterized protein n=1 Tax=Pyrenophora tritici-repentis TaxID=45151 RepID=A0A834VQU1_9PLEO|nr:hypothetical protein PtrM4_089640 [Pyrenophora tritici-repentis]